MLCGLVCLSLTYTLISMVHDYQTDRGVSGLHGSKCSSRPGPGLGRDTNTTYEKHIDVMFYYLRKKVKLQTQEQYRDTKDNCLYKVYINNAHDRYCQQHSKVSQNEECLINIIKGFSIPNGLPWHLIDEVYIPINYGDEFHWMLAVIILKERNIRVYNSLSRMRHFGLSSQIQKTVKILRTYLDMSGFLDQKHCGPFVAAYAEHWSHGLQVPNNGLNAGLLRKRYATLLWKYGEAKAQKPYATGIKDPRRPKLNFVAPDEEQLVHID
ncbi:hypothetical protein BC332_24507 [Capsicum chinense]|nr:hypothetical protein BC332_24507 [Capsicum chinense]